MFNEIPNKTPMAVITEIEKSTLKFIQKHKRPQLTKKILSKKATLDVSQYPSSKYTTEP
jgi:hypothetical protein